MKRLLILLNDPEDPPGYLGEILAEYAIENDIIDVEKETIPDPTHYSAVIALGGPQHVYDEENYPYLAQEKTLIRRVVTQNIPYLGICLGGQLLADALQGHVKQHHMTEIGFYDVEITAAGQEDPLYAGLPGYQKVFQWHEDSFVLPVEAVLLATNENTQNQAFRYGRSAYGLQYHIELNTELLDNWLYKPTMNADIRATIGEDGYQNIIRERASAIMTYNEHTRIMFTNFLRLSHLISSNA